MGYVGGRKYGTGLIRTGRDTALVRLGSELPAPVMAGLLGVDVATATRRAGYAKRDWYTRLADDGCPAIGSGLA